MPLIAKDKGGEDFEPIPAGMHLGICYGVVDIGTQPAFGPIPPKRKVVIIFELPEERADFTREKNGVKEKVNLPRATSLTFTNSLNKKSNLRPMLESWRGRQFTEQELEGFDLFNIVGANALLNMIQEKKGDKTYSNIKTVNPLPKGSVKKTQENPPLKFSLDEIKPGQPIVFPDNMPDWLKGKILQSDEYIRHQQQPGGPPPQHNESRTTENLDEDVPF